MRVEGHAAALIRLARAGRMAETSPFSAGLASTLKEAETALLSLVSRELSRGLRICENRSGLVRPWAPIGFICSNDRVTHDGRVATHHGRGDTRLECSRPERDGVTREPPCQPVTTPAVSVARTFDPHSRAAKLMSGTGRQFI